LLHRRLVVDSRKHECDLESHLHMSRNTGAMVSILPSFHPLGKLKIKQMLAIVLLAFGRYF